MNNSRRDDHHHGGGVGDRTDGDDPDDPDAEDALHIVDLVSSFLGPAVVASRGAAEAEAPSSRGTDAPNGTSAVASHTETNNEVGRETDGGRSSRAGRMSPTEAKNTTISPRPTGGGGRGDGGGGDIVDLGGFNLRRRRRRRPRRRGGDREDVVVVFSKDRPWQLRQLLRSMRLGSRSGCGCRYRGGVRSKDPAMTTTTTAIAVTVVVVVRITSPRYGSAYRLVRDEFEGSKFTGDVGGCGVALLFEYESNDTVGSGSSSDADGRVGDGDGDGTFAEILERIVFHRRSRPCSGDPSRRRWRREEVIDDGTEGVPSPEDRKDATITPPLDGNDVIHQQEVDGPSMVVEEDRDEGEEQGDREEEEDGEDLIMFLTDDCLLLEPLRRILSVARGCLYPHHTDGGLSCGGDAVMSRGGGTPGNNDGNDGGMRGGGESGGTKKTTTTMTRVAAFLSRLHPGISWCQTRDVPSPRPNDMRYVQVVVVDGGGEEPSFSSAPPSTDGRRRHDGAFIWPYRHRHRHRRRVGGGGGEDANAGTGAGDDWSYPFDLSGGAYRRADVESVLDSIRSRGRGARAKAKASRSRSQSSTSTFQSGETSRAKRSLVSDEGKGTTGGAASSATEAIGVGGDDDGGEDDSSVKTTPASAMAPSVADDDANSFGYSHPNRLEVSGNVALAELLLSEEEEEARKVVAERPRATGVSDGDDGRRRIDGGVGRVCNRQHFLACPSRPSLVVLAINRVQDVFAAPLASGPHDDADDAEARGTTDGGGGDYDDEGCEEDRLLPRRRYDASSLLDLFEAGGGGGGGYWDLDLERYRRTAFNSSHVGCVFPLPPEKGGRGPSPHRRRLRGGGNGDGSGGERRPPVSSPSDAGEGSDNVDGITTVSEDNDNDNDSGHDEDDDDDDDDDDSCCPCDHGLRPALSVLLPIHAGPPRAARHAMASIVMQLVEGGVRDDHNGNDSGGCHRSDESELRHDEVGSNGVGGGGEGPTSRRAAATATTAASGDGGSPCRVRVTISPLQIVIVDDRCADGSVDACVDAASELAAGHGIVLRLRDDRGSHQRCHPEGDHHNQHEPTRGRHYHPDGDDDYDDGCRVLPASVVGDQGERSTEETSLPPVLLLLVDVVSSPAPGVGAALNHGLRYCLADLVARMDADDVCEPDRFVSQMEFLREDPSTSVLGTCAILFHRRHWRKRVVVDDGAVPHSPSPSPTEDDLTVVPNGGHGHIVEMNAPGDDDPTSSHREERRCILPFDRFATQDGEEASATRDYIIDHPSINPTDPGFLAWSILFSCRICHPSVMFRRDAIVSAGGYLYDESSSISHHAEDYDLWLRMTSSDCRSVRSLPRVGVWHRKHPGGTSGRNLDSQRGQADVAAHARMVEMLGEGDDLEPMSCVGGGFGRATTGPGLSPSTQIPTVRCVAALRRPETAETASDLDDAATLLLRLESSFLRRHGGDLTAREVALIGSDCDSRLGELATISVGRFGRRRALQRPLSASAVSGGGAWQLWCVRRPDLHLERMSLLCHSS